MLQQQFLAVLADAREFIEHRFLNPPFPQFLVILVGKPMRFVAQPLEQMQGRGGGGKAEDAEG